MEPEKVDALNDNSSPPPARQISRIETTHIERLHAGQVIVDLCSIVKELLENALDAGASSVVIDLDQYGREVQVGDNGSGISPSDFANVARKHHTSKLASFDDLESISSFGFRGEALAALANVARLSICTRRACDANGTRLEFDASGEVISSIPASHAVGTTVVVKDVFHNLPVRQEEFLKNIKREYAKLLPVIQSYMLICSNVKISLYNTTTGKRQLVFASSGKADMRENAVLAFGSKEAKGLDLIEKEFTELQVKMEGLVTGLNSGLGRRTKDRHFFFLNKRPVDLPSFGKLITECFRVTSANQGKFPTIVLNFNIKSEHIDLNVTPEKRTVFVAIEAKLLEAMREFMSAHFGSAYSSAVPVVMNEAAQTGAIPKRFIGGGAPESMNRNSSAPLPSTTWSVQTTLLSQSGPVVSSSPKLFEAFGFRRATTAPASTMPALPPQQQAPPPLSSLPTLLPPQSVVAEAPVNLSCHDHDCHQHHQVDWDAPIVIEEEVELIKEEAQTWSPLGFAVSSASPPQPKSNMFADMFAFGVTSTKRASVVTDLPVQSFADAVEIPILPSSTKRAKVEYIDEDENVDEEEEKFSSFSTKRPRTDEGGGSSQEVPAFFGDERIPYMDVSSSQAESGFSISVDLEEMKSLLKRRRESRHEVSQRSDAPPMFKKEYFKRLQVIGQFNKGFIITRFENTSDLFIVDQHASNEIFNFENLQNSTALRVQRLLAPITIQFSPDEEIDVASNLNVFERNGFLLEYDEASAPGRKIKLVGRPESKDTVFGESDVRELAELVRQAGRVTSLTSLRPSKVRAMFASRACRMSIMIGDPLSHEQMEKVVKDLATLDAPWACPHGRPTFKHLFKITEDE